LLSLCSPALFAQFNKCTTKDGKIVYTDAACPPGSKGPRGAAPSTPQIVVPDLSWDKQVIAHWCVERWQGVSPRGRADKTARLYQEAGKGGEKTKENLRKQGLSLEQAIAGELGSEARMFNTDCGQFGFRSVDAKTDEYNERMSRALKHALDTKYPDSRAKFEQARDFR
jgi:hypothetical protein